MNQKLFDMFESLDRHDKSVVKTRELAVKAPFGYPGGKSRSIPHILQHIPYHGKYVEVFGGSGVVLLNRKPEKMEVYNDKYGAVVDFYKCIKDPVLLAKLIEYLDLTLKSREMFLDSKDLFVSSKDTVERAANWYYMVMHSFSKLGRNFGRDLNKTTHLIDTHFPIFKQTHQRLKNVLIENLDWSTCLKDFDSYDTVYYCDPPYMNTTTSGNLYEHGMSIDDHNRLCEAIFHTKGFVALSGYENELYSTFPWDDIQMWEVNVSMTAMAFSENNNFEDKKDSITRGKRTERLYIKHAR